MAAIAYTDRRGRIGFRAGNHAPRGTIVFARHRDVGELEEIVGAVARRGRDGKTLLVPGVPESTSEREAREALQQWRDWAFARYGISNGIVLITDSASEARQ